MNCRGDKRREEIVKRYNLKITAHVRLLNQQTKQSCTNIILTDSYYCFTYRNKENNNQRSFFCGSHAAKHFLQLTGIEPVPLFSPLVAEHNNGIRMNNNQNNRNQRPWNQMARQLSNAINLIVVCWNIAPSGALANIREKINRYYYNPPYLREIKAVNTIISSDQNGYSLQEMIGKLRRHNNIRNFDFGLLNNELTNNNVESYYG